MLFHIIADYGPGDLAFAEVVQRIKMVLPDAECVPTPVPAFSTLAAGFCIAQLGLNEAPAGTIIYHNVAPREDDEVVREGNAGERLVFARLPSGARVIGVHAGHAFSFVRDAVAEGELRYARVPDAGSQFRSRDLFPQAAAAIALGEPDALAETVAPEDVPDAPPDRIAYIDGYGNLKTTFAHGAGALNHLSSGSLVRVRIGGAERQATVSDGSFEIESGQLAFAPGSSGWTLPDGRAVRYMELFLRGGNAWEEFERPAVGARIEIQSAA